MNIFINKWQCAHYKRNMSPGSSTVHNSLGFSLRKAVGSDLAVRHEVALSSCLSNQEGEQTVCTTRWVLEGDIKACFDKISHQWLLENIPMDKRVLKRWLKAGFVHDKEWYPCDSGAAQGGSASPTIFLLIAPQCLSMARLLLI